MTDAAHRRSSGPSLTAGYVVRSAQAVLRPPPTPTRPVIHFPASPVIGRHAPATLPQVTGPGRASPVPAATIDAFRAPYAGEFLTAAIQDLHRFHGLHPDFGGSALPAPARRTRPLTTPQASRHATDRIVAPPYRAFDAGLRPGPFPDRAASLLPGLLAATRTGLPPAGDDELTNSKIRRATSQRHLPLCWAHESPRLGKARKAHTVLRPEFPIETRAPAAQSNRSWPRRLVAPDESSPSAY